MRKMIVLSAVVAAALVQVEARAQQFEIIRTTGTFAERKRFELMIRCAPYTAKRFAGIQHFWGGDGPDFRPLTVMTEFRLTLDKQKQKIPREAYEDLGDTQVPNGPFHYGDAGEVVVEIGGGDAAGSYRCEFIFKNGRLVRREIYGYLADPRKPTEVKQF